jgi:hypothetical protein
MGSVEIQGWLESRSSGRRTLWLLLSCIGAGIGGGCYSLPKINLQQSVIQCSVTRQECLAEEIGDGGGVTCAQYSPSTQPPFTATTCAFTFVPFDGSVMDPNTACTQAFCAQAAGVAYGYPMGCTATGTDVSNQIPPAGVCVATSSTSGLRLSHITYSQRWHDCDEAPGGAFCATLPPNNFSGDGCFAVDSSPAINFLPGPTDRRDPTLLISAYVANAPDCPLYGIGPAAGFELTPGTIGTASGGGVTAPLTVVSGFATSGQVCGSSGCSATIDRLRANLADQVVSGFQVSNLVVNSVQPIVVSGVGAPDSGLVTLPAAAVNLVATARVNGVQGLFVLANHAPFQARVTTTGLTLKGPLDMVVSDTKGRPLPISMPISLTGTPANAQTKSCIAMSSVNRLFGFENPLDWNATNASLSLVTSPITQGCGALGVAGQGYMPITSAPFPTSALSVQNAVSVDLFIPANQPNPSWLGAVQAYLTCPSANFFNQYIGQVELTGKPQNQFSTLRFSLPAPIVSTLGRSLNDCFWGLTLNVNRTGRTWIFDNLRFTP